MKNDLVTKLQIEGMDCQDEVKSLTSALMSLPGIKKIEPNLITSQVVIFHSDAVSLPEIKRKIKGAGLEVGQTSEENKEKSGAGLSIPLLASGVFFALAFSFSRFDVFSEALVRILYLVSILFGGKLIAPKAWRGIRSLSLDMNVLMAVATLGAIGIGEYAEAAAVVFLFALAEWLETFSLQRARRSVKALLTLAPEVAFLQNSDGKFSDVPVSAVEVGAIIRIKTGARIPLDGIVKSGISSVNQAPITGESLPVEKREGDKVLAGTVNGEGSLDVVVTQGFQDTKIAQIVKLIEDAQNRKAPTQRFVDNFAKFYTPIIFAFAIGVMLVPPIFFAESWSVWIYRALVLLVIACPCALVIATPVSIVSGLTALAKKGVLIKGGVALEALGKLTALAVDKTGTITEGVPKVHEVYSLNGMNENDLLAIAASIDQHSMHPLAKAVVAEALRRGVDVKSSVDYRSVNGRGAEALIDEHAYFVGNHKFAHDFAVCSDELERLLLSLEDKARSVVIVGHRPHPGCQGEVLGVLGLGDTIRGDAIDAIKSLHAVGVKAVLMLSGDNQRTVTAISKQVGIDEAYGDLLPNDKVLKIKELKERFNSVAMIGDGVNDAPAMATATLGIAMGASGTDVAIETSDVTLMRDHLTGISDAIAMGRKTLKIIWFNTGFALVTKFLFLTLSISGISSLWLAIAADTGTTLIVIGNALRLLK